MTKSTKFSPGERTAKFLVREIKHLRLCKDMNIYSWMHTWHQANRITSKKLSNEVELTLIKSILEVGDFSFVDGHALHNEGSHGIYPRSSLGRRAMLVGLGFAMNALTIKQDELISCQNIVGKMMESLHEPSEDDKLILGMINGKLKGKIQLS